jgi:cytoskeletal protein CcmA (bactofilin family)
MDETTSIPLELQNEAAFEEPFSDLEAGQVASTGEFSPVSMEAVPAVENDDLSALVAPVAADPTSAPKNSTTPNDETGEKGISIIAREATVLGDIITEGHIDVIGKVRGNIAAQGDVAIHGQVRGNIDGDKIGLYNSRVKGNLKAGQGVIVNDTSIIDGDVTTKNIIFDGKVRGSIAAESVVVLRSHSYCLGDVTAASIAVEPGAVINGNVRTLIDGDLEAPFEEII